MGESKEVAILAHIYKGLKEDEEFTEEMQEDIHSEISELLESKGYSFQFHEAEIREL